MKRILAATAATLMAASLTACGGGDDGSDGKTTVVFAYWGSDARQQLTEAARRKDQGREDKGVDRERAQTPRPPR